MYIVKTHLYVYKSQRLDLEFILIYSPLSFLKLSIELFSYLFETEFFSLTQSSLLETMIDQVTQVSFCLCSPLKYVSAGLIDAQPCPTFNVVIKVLDSRYDVEIHYCIENYVCIFTKCQVSFA